MVRDFQTQTGGDTGEQVVGRLTGLLAATFCAAQLVTSYPWGMLSDRIGRKVRAGKSWGSRAVQGQGWGRLRGSRPILGGAGLGRWKRSWRPLS